MNRYLIEDAIPHQRADFGPMAIIGSAVKYREDNGETKWIYCTHISEGPHFALSKENLFEEIMELEFPEGLIPIEDSFEGLSWEPSEEGLFILFRDNKNNNAANLMHYVYDFLYCAEEREAKLLSFIGHYTDEIDILTDGEDLLEELKERWG